MPAPQGVTVAFASIQLGPLAPGDTTVTASTPAGINILGLSDGVGLNFNLMISPDTTSNLGSFLDVHMNGWNINDGFPAHLVTNAVFVIYHL